MVELGGEVRFAQEALAIARVGGGAGGEQLQRVEPRQPRVADQVDLAHAARPEQSLDAKACDDITSLVHRHRPQNCPVACVCFDGLAPLSVKRALHVAPRSHIRRAISARLTS